MKKQILSIASLVLLSGVLVMTSCKKPDETAPTLSLKGDGSSTIDLGASYADAGATASDDKDGDISAKIVMTGSVDVNKVGTYTLKYNVSDEAGNIATEVTRTVKVKSDKLAGTYAVSDIVTDCTPSTGNGTYTYSVTVTQSSTDYNKILLGGFAGINGASVYGTVEGTTVTIPSQPVNGANPATNVSGTGTFTSSGGVFKISNVTYTASNAFFGKGNATYTKQ